MTEVEFSSADIADAIKRANIVAPTRGRELDMYKGFIFDLDPEEKVVRLRVTNGELYYTEYLYPTRIVADGPLTWRVASPSTHGIVTNLAPSSIVTMKDEGGKLRISSGRMRAATPFISSGDYPHPDAFMYELQDMQTLSGWGARMDTVGWTVSPENLPPRCGIYMSSTHMCATNSKVLARIPNEFVLPEGRDFVVLPYKYLAGVLRNLHEVQVGIQGGNLVISPTEDIFIKCSLFEDKFDPVDTIMDKTHETELTFDRDAMLAVLSRVTTIGASDRQVTLEAWIGGGQIALCIRDRISAEEIEESLDVEGADHPVKKFMFSVEYFMDTVSKMTSPQVVMDYSPSKPYAIVKFTSAQGLEVVIQPRRETSARKDDE